MARSSDRILTTHAGSLPRPAELLPLLLAQEAGETVDAAQLESEVRSAVNELLSQR